MVRNLPLISDQLPPPHNLTNRKESNQLRNNNANLGNILARGILGESDELAGVTDEVLRIEEGLEGGLEGRKVTVVAWWLVCYPPLHWGEGGKL